MDDGLSQSAITSFVQDKYGYLWIATLDGLNRYDGNTFKVYRNSNRDSTSISTNTLTKLFLDKEKNVWISYRNGISKYNPVLDNFSNFSIEQIEGGNLFIRDFKQISGNSALICTNNGIYTLDLIQGRLSEAKQFEHFKGKNISNLYITESGTWVFSQDEAWLQPSGTSTWKKMVNTPERLMGYYDVSQKSIYVHTREAFSKFNPITQAFDTFVKFPPESDYSENGLNVLKTSQNEFWLNRGSIMVFDSVGNQKEILREIPQNPNSLSGNYVTDMMETRDGVVWIGTNGIGFNKFNPSRSVFGILALYPGAPLTLSSNFVNAIYTPDDTHLYVGTLEGLDVIDFERNVSKHLPVIARNGRKATILKIIEDRDHSIWLCTNKGLMTFRNGQVLLCNSPMLQHEGLSIYSGLETTDSKLLLSTNQGLILWDKKNSARKVLQEGSMVLNEINNHYWIESGGNISLVDKNSFSIKETFVSGADHSAIPTSIKCFYQDQSKNVWIGSWGGGLNLYQPANNSFSSFGEEDGLPNQVVYGVLEDSNEVLWLSTNNGICAFDKKTKQVIRNFNKSDGLQGNEFNTGAHFQSARGTMYFGGVNGLTYFNPKKALSIPTFIPKSIVTGFYINNIRVDQWKGQNMVGELTNGSRINLDWSERDFGFDVGCLGFTFPSGTQYMYKLENFDQDWKYNREQKRITFTNVPKGNYTLLIKSGNSFGEWEKQALAIPVTVTGPIWLSRWFIAASLFGLITGFYLLFGQRNRMLRRRAVKLQQIVDARTRELQVQREEIAAQNEELISQSESLEQHNLELEKTRTSLEKLVAKRTEELQKSNHSLVEQNTQLEQFAFITAHNIRGPVARIKGLIHLLSISPEDYQEILLNLQGGVNTLDEVLNDLNTILNIQYGIEKTFESVSLKEQMTLTLQSLHEQITSIQAKIDVEGFNENIRVFGIKPYVQSILHNLIHNALKYSNNVNQTHIRCSASQEGNKIKIVIADNGLGIDMRYAQNKLFKLYQRFHPNITGKGMGLFLVKTQVLQMSGQITVQSEPHKGTKFTIELPAMNVGQVKDDVAP